MSIVRLERVGSLQSAPRVEIFLLPRVRERALHRLRDGKALSAAPQIRRSDRLQRSKHFAFRATKILHRRE